MAVSPDVYGKRFRIDSIQALDTIYIKVLYFRTNTGQYRRESLVIIPRCSIARKVPNEKM